MNVELTAPYLEQVGKWPRDGRHILARYDTENIVVYQAYRPEIGKYAVKNQRFGGPYSFNRMSWIKPNFLWMMYRSGWGTKEGQEVTLAITIPRTLFEEILIKAVPSTFDAKTYESHEQWKQSLTTSEVRLQWDPDHAPDGKPQERRAIQLGLRGQMLRRFAVEEVISIEDVSSFVAEQYCSAIHGWNGLRTPIERVYFPEQEDAIKSIGLDHMPSIE